MIFNRPRSRCRQTSGELPGLLNSGELVALLSLNLGCASCLKALAFAY